MEQSKIQKPKSKIPNHFLAALQFLTVVPPLVRRPFTLEELGGAVGYFPFIGVLLGLVLTALHAGLRQVLPQNVVAALVLAAWVILTGALHLDGFLDSCDGLFGGATPEDRLRILRDEQVGAFALAGGVSLLLVKYAALSSLDGPFPALFLAPALARWGMTVAVVAFPYARPEGLGRAMKDHAGPRALAMATVVAFSTAWLAGGTRGLLVGALVATLTWATARFTMARIPGLTGDIYGTICELAEVLVLVVYLV